MNVTVKKLTKDMAIKILKWSYDEPYDFYNNELSTEAMAELLNESFLGIINENEELIGYFCSGKSAQVPIGHEFLVYQDDCIDMGLGMNPNLVGKGNGTAFCSIIIKYLKEQNQNKPIRLTVATFNHRAIHLYEKLRFKKKDEFSAKHADFQTMILG